MVRQRPWDKYEAAILLEAVIKIYQGEVERKQAIADVSDKLRKKALNEGLEIDDIYRNIAGITFQMYSMESAYVGYTIRKPATKLFLEIVKTMKDNKEEYDEILQEAKTLVGENKSLEEKYLNWLSAKVSHMQMTELYVVYSQIEEFCLSRKILKKPLFETTESDILTNVQNTVENNGFFRFRYKKQIKKMSLAIRYYISFIKEEKNNRVVEINRAKTNKDVEWQENNISNTEDIQDAFLDNVIFIDPEQRKKEFMEWMTINGMSTGTVRPYISSLGLSGKIAQENGIIQTDVFCIDDAEVLKKALCELMTNREFVEKNEYRHNQLRAVWGKYIQFSGDDSFNSRTVTEISNANNKIENTALYMRLKSMAGVYDDVNGFNIEWIKSMIGLSIDTEELKSVLDDIPWVTEIAENVYSFSKNAKPLEQSNQFDKESFIKVLLMRYPNGMRFDSIDFDNFRETYANIIGEEINFTDKELEICLRKCGVLYQGCVFPADGIVNSSTREKLMEYITNSFASGKQVLYYKAIYSDLSDAFAYCFNLTDAMMLKPYLEYVCEPDEYYFTEDYMSKERNVKINHSAEIEAFLLSMGKPLSYDEICVGLSHISKDVIYSGIKSNPNIILNEKGHYFHYGIFELSSEDADRISGFISEDIEEDSYCIWSRVFVKIQQKMPLFIENNVYLSSIGIRNAISKKLSGRFNFDSEVICKRGQSFNMADVYRLYGEHQAPFSDDDIYEFSREVSGGVIYFDSLSETTVRTSRKQFVHRADVKFDVEATDNALETYLSTGYLLIRDIDSFLMFPNVGYEWNAFLLESYLMYYSSKYALLNNGRSLNNVAGALVRRGSGYDDFVDVCADVIAKRDCALTKQKALDYLVEQNLLTRRRYSKIDSAITKAKQIRNKKG